MKKWNTLDKVLLSVALFLCAFVITTIIIYTYKDWNYDVLISCVMGGGGLEAIAGAIIQVAKYKHKDKGEVEDGISDMV